MTAASGTVPLPPLNASVKTTCCEYCPVACGYKVYTWPLGEDGGLRAHQNALSRSFPLTEPESGWPTPNMHNIIDIGGVDHNVLILPDRDAQVVNINGNHSVRGGALAQKLYVADGPTGDRLLEPMLRVNGTLQPIGWDLATDIVAQVSTYVIDQHGPIAWGMKRYSYGGHENVTAITKLAYRAIGSANHAPHHAPAGGDDAPGLSDAGIDAFSACFEDDKQADVLFISGTDPYETKTVRFLEWSTKGGAKIVYVDPRKTFTAAYAVAEGGIHLQLNIGTDLALYGAIARYIVEQGWEDTDFISSFTASSAEVAAESHWRRKMFGGSFTEFESYLLAEDAFRLADAEAITGVAAAKIQAAAAMISGGGVGLRPKTTFLFEKGLYWTHLYENTAAIANLAVLLGSTGRPGRAISRLGGHQRGGQSAGGYPLDQSPDEFLGNKIEMDTDRYFMQGNTRLMWAIGTNWIGASACSSAIESSLKTLVQETGPQVSSTASAIAELKARVDAGGTVFIHQEIYANETTQYADLVLPAAAWGEKDFARANAERRLRLYEKFMDPPGQARDDWEIVAEVAQKMGYSGFDWANVSELFEEAAGYSSGSRRDFSELALRAQADGLSGHELLRSFGTEGIQTPIRDNAGTLLGTPRLHADIRFKTNSGKANFVLADWATVAARNAAVAPSGNEVWVTNMRVNHLWNNMSDFIRRPYALQRWPANILQVNPDDAAAQSIQSGDLLKIESANIVDQLGRTIASSFEAVAYVTDEVPPGVTCSYFQYPGNFANNLVSADTTLQPMNARYQFKMGRGQVTKIGVWDGDPILFEPRNIY